MKKVFFLFLICAQSFAFIRNESGPGNGTDFVKVLFANARTEVIALLEGINEQTIAHLELDDHFKEWLLSDVEGSPRYIKLKFYAKNFVFKFQEETCPDQNSICFYLEDEALIVVSLKENQNTTEKQAVTMLLHEIGHFAGENDHLFLDRFGSELVASSESAFVVVEKSNKRYVSNIFAASNDCERGEGEQVENLKTVIASSILEQCLRRKLSCDTDQIHFSFSAQLPSVGLGFDSTAKCIGKGLLKAKRTSVSK